MRPRTLRRRTRCLLTLSACIATLTAERAVHAEPSSLPPEIGFNSGESDTGRSVAMAGALRAFSNSTEAVSINPANIAAARVYHVGGRAEFWPQANRQSYGATVIDSIVSQSRLAGAVSGAITKQDADGVNRSAMDARMVLAFPFSNQFLLGGTAHFLQLSQDGHPQNGGLPPSAAAGGLAEEHIVRDFTFDGGITLRPASGLSLGIVGYNLTDPGHGFAPLMLGSGVGYGNDDFTIEGDVLFDFSTYEKTQSRAMIGGEFLAADNYPLRLGYRYDEAWNMHAISGGVGYLSREFSFDLGARHAVDGPASTTVVLSFKVHMESTGVGGSVGGM